MKIILFVVGGIGLCMALIAGALFVREVSFVNSAQETTGRITGYGLAGDSGDSSYCPQVQFTSADGQSVEFEARECLDSRPYEIGDPVQVYYDPDDPQRSHRLKSFSEQWLGPTLLSVCSAPLLLVGIVGLFMGMRKA